MAGASQADTFDYMEEFRPAFARTFYRPFASLAASSVGLGTAGGDPTPEGDARLRDVLAEGFAGGANLIDTASNYRHGRAERVVGEAIRESDVDRSRLVVVTKGGFVPFDGERPDSPGRFVREQYVDGGPLSESDLARGSHALTPGFVGGQVDRSLDRLGLDAVDCYLVHHPEVQRETRDESEVYDRLESVFEVLERRVAAGDVGCYGVATWDAFRVPRDHERYLSLPDVVSRARAASDAVGTAATGFRAVQVPFAATNADAFRVASQPGPEGDQSVLQFCMEAGIDVLAAAPLAGGTLAAGVPDAVGDRVGGDTPAQRALNFARSAPGVTSAVVGTTDADHVQENLAAGTFEPLGARAFDAVFE